MLFSDLKPGDKVLHRTTAVLVRSKGWNQNHLTTPLINAHTVERVTATQATTDTGIRFRLDDGKIIGSNGSVYPMGYVNPTAGNAIESKPMTPTSPDQRARVAEVQGSVKTLQNAIQAFLDAQEKSLRTLIQSEGWEQAIAYMQAATQSLQQITTSEGDK